MKLNFQVDESTFNGLDDGVKSLYVKSGDSYVLDVDGVAPKGKIDEFRENNIELRKQLEKFQGIDVDEYNRLIQEEQKKKDKKLLDAGKVDELVNERTRTMKEQYEGKMDELSKQNESMKSQLETLLIDNAVRDAASKEGVVSSAVDDVLLRAKSIFKVIDGVATPMDGDRVIYGKDAQNPMSVSEWLKGLSSTAPHLFEPSTGGGGRGTAGRANGADNPANMKPIDKIKLGLRA